MAVMRWLMQFAGFTEMLLGDLFLDKIAMECGVNTSAEYERWRENFFHELEVVFVDMIIIRLCLCVHEQFGINGRVEVIDASSSDQTKLQGGYT
ncbi:unnamed protein product [Eruca vesicaria subsp. sativa]|uniref:Uncharacterized protein n=1 Tax=Eruca vesicaria subsp. sativa TaxID=29727 RepID=A0ABC8KI29_ERUVS|nr:unnamed protein product [Eruca vesicaria subsp. sativa]